MPGCARAMRPEGSPGCESHQRLGECEVLVHRHHVVDDDAIRLAEYRTQLAHQTIDQRVVRFRPLALGQRMKVAQHALVARIDLGDARQPHALRRAAPPRDDRHIGARLAERGRVRAHDLLDTAEDRRGRVVDQDHARTPARHAVAAALVTRPRPPAMRSSHAGSAGSSKRRCVFRSGCIPRSARRHRKAIPADHAWGMHDTR